MLENICELRNILFRNNFRQNYFSQMSKKAEIILK